MSMELGMGHWRRLRSGRRECNVQAVSLCRNIPMSFSRSGDSRIVGSAQTTEIASYGHFVAATPLTARLIMGTMPQDGVVYVRETRDTE